MLRYRWCQFLSDRLEVPYILIVIMWFEYRINDSMNQVFIISPAKIIDQKKDINNLGKSIHRPLNLQIINRDEAFNSILRVNSLSESDLDLDSRAPLQESLSREWAYEKINNSAKGKQIKQWTKKKGKVCPEERCNHVRFESLKMSNIAFGHIISQHWSRSFTYLLDKKDHPDNLYLTCQNCNASLSNNFPDKTLRRKIYEEGTIGDWLREAVDDIRNMKL
jgi:hypothetical protein